MPLTKKFQQNADFVGEFPVAPSAQLLEAIKGAATRAIGNQLTTSGWRVGEPVAESNDGRLYTLTLPFKRIGQRQFQSEDAETQLTQIVTRLLTGSTASRMTGWKPVGVHANAEMENDSGIAPEEMLVLPDNWEEFFDDIYEREIQIKRIMRSIDIARQSRMCIRDHILLYGPPGAGKSSILLAIQHMLTDVAVKRMDATDTTRVGAINSLLDATPLPAIIAIEELEKVHDSQIPYLLAIMDDRAEIIRTTARNTRQKKVPCLVIATVNDVAKLKQSYSGALYNRFGCPVYCPMPSTTLIKRILQRQVLEIPGGNPAWIEPAMKYALEEECTHQIRRIKSILVNGGDGLLDGSYQEEQRSLRESEARDSAVLQEFYTPD